MAPKDVHVHLPHVWSLIGVFRVPFGRYPGSSMYLGTQCFRCQSVWRVWNREEMVNQGKWIEFGGKQDDSVWDLLVFVKMLLFRSRDFFGDSDNAL